MTIISNRSPSKKLTFEDAVEIWPKIWAENYQNRIAAEYDVNPGRISEIKTERAHIGSYEIAVKKFGSPKIFNEETLFPYLIKFQNQKHQGRTMASQKRSRSAITGKYVTKAYAKKHPKTTVNETIKKASSPKKKK